MTAEDKQIAVAKVCGRCTCKTYKKPGDWETAACDECGKNPFFAEHNIPDYVNDLNAMHGAEHHLSKAQADAYGILLEKPRPDVNKGGYGWHATAEQRADAFLLVTSTN